jgi:hypothetical protein
MDTGRAALSHPISCFRREIQKFRLTRDSQMDSGAAAARSNQRWSPDFASVRYPMDAAFGFWQLDEKLA